MKAHRPSIDVTRLKAASPRWALKAADVTTRAVALGTALDRPGPDFLVIGTKRGGTTSLFRYLVQHPGILGTFPRMRAKKSTDYFFAGNSSSEVWYRSHFHSETYRKKIARRIGYRPLGFEASPYYVWDPRIAGRAKELDPSLKAIVLLRDPVRRAWSHYQERVQNGVEPLTFAQALDAEDDRLEGEVERMIEEPSYHSTAHDWYSYRTRGEYVPQLENWHACFPREQLLVLRSEDLYAQTQAVYDTVCDFLGIPRFDLPSRTPHNATWRTRDDVPDDSARELRQHYVSRNSSLEDYLDIEIAWPTG